MSFQIGDIVYSTYNSTTIPIGVFEVVEDNDTSFPIVKNMYGSRYLSVKHNLRPATNEEKRIFIHNKLLKENMI